jgi:hypothetical protein
VVLIVLVALLDRLGAAWSGRTDGPVTFVGNAAWDGLRVLVRGFINLRPGDGARGGFDITRGLLDDLWAAPWSSGLVLLATLLVVAIFGLAIARSAATEAARLGKLGWTQTLRFAATKWVAAWMTLVGPILAAAVLFLAIAAAGWVFLSLPWVQVLGGVLFGVALLLATAGVLVIALSLLGAPMLLPALACEGSDAIDAVQRVMAYVSARPVQYLAYVLVLCLQAAITTGMLIVLAVLVSEAAGSAATAWTPAAVDPGRIWSTSPGSGPSGSLRAMDAGIRFWLGIPMLLVGGYVVSFVHTGGTMLYLAMRRVCDGQDVDDIWMPGAILGLQEPAGDARSEAMSGGSSGASSSASGGADREGGADDDE